MRQCQMNLTLSSQQSDEMKTKELRDEMQKLNQQQAKLHFTMDELIKKENKIVPIPRDKNISGHYQYHHQPPHHQQPQQFVAVNEAVTYVGQQIPQQITMLSPQGSNQVISPQVLSPQIISPKISIVPPQQVSPLTQVRIDDRGRVVQMRNDANTPLVIYDGDNRNKTDLNYVNYVNM